MPYWLANAASQQRQTWVKRFDPVYWTVDFPRPMMAGVTTSGPHGLRVDLSFYRRDDLAGLIWTSEDTVDHPLLAYETNRDFRRCQLRFRWRSSGVKALDAVNGPVLTIEGRDAGGAAKSWYVRLWNYAVGTPTDAVVSLDFGALDGGFLLPGEADPVWAGDVDRMFLSLVSGDYDGTAANLAAPVEAWVTLDDIACDGSGSVLALGDVHVPPHGLGIATGYDDSYNVTPARLVRNIVALGYRGAVNHYVGMSHYYRLEAIGGGHYVSLTGGALNGPCAAWHADWAARLKAAGLGLIVSLSYELFDANCWNDWKQRASNGDPALTGWVPPSTLLSPAHGGAMAYLQAVARAFVQIAVSAGHSPRFQIGEPWWWVMPDHRICLYDDAAKAALGGSPLAIDDVRGSLNAAKRALLDAAGALLAASTAALHAAVRADYAACERLLLAYLPTVADEAAPEVKRANLPVGWASPAFDVLQLEDYDWVTTGNRGASARAWDAATARLGYSKAGQHYFSGFVLRPEDAAQWTEIAAAAEERAPQVAETFIWALPQVLRDGFTYFRIGEDDVTEFDEVDFPLAVGRAASVEPGFSTQVVTTASGHEQRNADWASARMRYDAGPGVRSEADLATLIAFFRARRGAAKAFRFRDPLDHSSKNMTGVPDATDQLLGTGDGVRTRFALVKRYGDGADAEVRPITRPVAVSVRVAVGGVEAVSGWTLGAGGVVDFAVAPGAGATVTAGYLFDVPVRFAEDRLGVSLATFMAGEVGAVELIEVREVEVSD
ncbi:DUF2460 domain-containing protein [Sphingomonas sp. SUN039]|uniref:DUF2460 domain-containing protein n=1 Tax=Sphingomonas sp. SUN039 TaxID=2937787 RepID=UPI0021645BA8|nr:DUF2460 domain-containing protein [Sphingomonas sp. SUN039]UVO52974.1 DUF2460 domain-containing protein [Sphingomonas sp. SUN039]